MNQLQHLTTLNSNSRLLIPIFKFAVFFLFQKFDGKQSILNRTLCTTADVPQGQRCYRPSKESLGAQLPWPTQFRPCASHLWALSICSAPHLNVATSLPFFPPALLLLILQLVQVAYPDPLHRLQDPQVE